MRPAILRRLPPRHLLTAAWMAWTAFHLSRRYDVVVTDSEHVGLPFALLLAARGSRTGHVLIVHRVSTRLKSKLVSRLRERGVNRFVFHFPGCELVLAHSGIRQARRRWIPYMVDTQFWRPLPAAHKRQICSAGLEFRDYPTLVSAVDGLDIDVEIAAGSPWSQKRDTSSGLALPPTVRVGKRSYLELRTLYSESLFTVVPLVENDMQAGITTIVESMAMGRAVVVSRTSGQTGTVLHGVTGLEVAPRDPVALKAALRWLLDHPDECRRMGEAGRQRVTAHMSIEQYVDRMATLVDEVAREMHGPAIAGSGRLALP
jgi:glycosyltransferase involved in cell wall biosynthesis